MRRWRERRIEGTSGLSGRGERGKGSRGGGRGHEEGGVKN